MVKKSSGCWKYELALRWEILGEFCLVNKGRQSLRDGDSGQSPKPEQWQVAGAKLQVTSIN
ncbi:hypothetical protein KC799_27550 [candidate division KSB1 bacterium]|nr:hypothetical protein [candidate division KSB1 bacterium]